MEAEHKARNSWQLVEYEYLGREAARGRTDAQIGATLGRSADDIFKTRKRLGIASVVGHSLTPWTDRDLSELCRMFGLGMTDEQIGVSLGRTAPSVRTARVRHEITRESPTVTRRPEYTIADVMNLPPLTPQEKDIKRRGASSVAFLISLKRAGHTYGQGEFSIPSENRVVRPSDLVGA